ncbi:hypothetical protein RKLH11_3024 [Rhodobacteraceae bacterium KLH11]|nr:hypothetical protein RKLH11_3024 [Rhodobacteraceae bacterium KLH11]
MKRLPVFNYKKHATGEPNFSGPSSKNGRFIVVRHSSGISKVKIYAKRGAKGLYTRNGTGEPLPVTVAVTDNLCTQGSKNLFTKKFHARLKNTFATQFYTPFTAAQNESQAISLAQTVLRATYCPKGEIKLNHSFQYVDKKGKKPVVKTSPAAAPWDSPPFDAQWTIQLTCSEWRKVQ